MECRNIDDQSGVSSNSPNRRCRNSVASISAHLGMSLSFWIETSIDCCVSGPRMRAAVSSTTSCSVELSSAEERRRIGISTTANTKTQTTIWSAHSSTSTNPPRIILPLPPLPSASRTSSSSIDIARLPLQPPSARTDNRARASRVLLYLSAEMRCAASSCSPPPPPSPSAICLATAMCSLPVSTTTSCPSAA
eukprot:3243254-Rhodomonas_salina.2